MYLSAREAGIQPRAFSFTKVRNVLNAFLPLIDATSDASRARKLTRDMLHYLEQAKLSRRQRRSSPRAVWPKPKSYPARHP